MTAIVQSAVPGEDYTLSVTLSNRNRININMLPYFDSIQFLPLKDREVWKTLKVQDGCLSWQGDVQLSVSALLYLFREETKSVQITEADAGDDWRLFLRLKSGSSLYLDMEPLLEYSVFAPMVQKKLWKSLRVKEHSLLWEDESLRLELPIETILKYFA
ncbi:MAG: hypothetical protein K0R50_2487 [Eubacterium sp.]|nr:hypothetical protein [Eubacterium sp.]